VGRREQKRIIVKKSKVARGVGKSGSWRSEVFFHNFTKFAENVFIDIWSFCSISHFGSNPTTDNRI
jgi:hypothetical protein